MVQVVRGDHRVRVDRVLSLSPVVGIGTPPPPYPQASVPTPPPGSGGRVHSLAVEGKAGSQFQRGDRHRGTLGIYVLCGGDSSKSLDLVR
jgi:hypothetical protein